MDLTGADPAGVDVVGGRPPALVWAAVASAGGIAACAATALWLAARLGGRGEVGAGFEVVGTGGAIALAILGAVLVVRSDVARVGWLLLAVAGGLAALNASYNATIAHALGVVDLGHGALVVAWVQHWMYPLPDVLALGVLPLLLPDGHAASPRWRHWIRVIALLTVVGCALLAFSAGALGNAFEGPLGRPGPPNPVGVLDSGAVETVGTLVIVALFGIAPVVALAGLVLRFRRADPLQRRQLGWIGLGIVVAILLAMAEQATGWLAPGINRSWPLTQVSGLLALAVLVAALAAGLLRFRLWDVDLVVNRTAVGLVMATGIVVVYATVVVVVGTLTAHEAALLPGVVGAGLVAAVANPLRVRATRAVNRLMFGDRDDPYAVLSRLGRALSQSPDGRSSMQQLTDTVAAALRVPYVAVELDEAVVAAAGTPRSAESFPLRNQGEAVGRLLVAPRTAYETLGPRDRHLLRQVADQAGPAVHATQLVRAAIAARARLAEVREEERRRLRRDLHDGLGPTLAGHSLALERALDLVDAGDPEARDVLLTLHEQTRALVAEIRTLVHDLRPPALDELGLARALRSLVEPYRARLIVELEADADELASLPAAVEVAIYRIVAEAVTNVVRHADARWCGIAVDVGGRQVRVRVSDDGRGRRPDALAGIGTTTMAERAEELGGQLRISDRETGGTVVDARFPLVATT